MRRFIRIDELSDYVTVSKGDVLNAIENKEITYCVPVDLKNMGAVAERGNQRYVHAVFDYSGMIFLGYESSRQLAIHAQPIDVDFIGVIEPDNITRWRSVPAVFLDVKNGALPFVNEPEEKPTGYFKAYASLTAGFTGEQVKSSLYNLFNAISQGSTTSPKPDTNQYLKSDKIKIHPNTLRIDLAQVQRVFPNPRDLGKEEQHQSALLVETHPIKMIIERVLSQDAQLKSGQIWTLLRQDIQSEQVRTFDVDALIFDMSADELHYFGQGDVTNKLARRRFQNLVSEVKRKVHG